MGVADAFCGASRSYCADPALLRDALALRKLYFQRDRDWLAAIRTRLRPLEEAPMPRGVPAAIRDRDGNCLCASQAVVCQMHGAHTAPDEVDVPGQWCALRICCTPHSAIASNAATGPAVAPNFRTLRNLAAHAATTRLAKDQYPQGIR